MYSKRLGNKMKSITIAVSIIAAFVAGAGMTHTVAQDRLGVVTEHVGNYVVDQQAANNTLNACYGVVTEYIVKDIRNKKMLGITE